MKSAVKYQTPAINGDRRVVTSFTAPRYPPCIRKVKRGQRPGLADHISGLDVKKEKVKKNQKQNENENR